MFSMGYWFLIFVLNYPNKQVLSYVYVNNSPAAAENTLVYCIKELNFKKELKNSRTGDSMGIGALLHVIGSPCNCNVEINPIS